MRLAEVDMTREVEVSDGTDFNVATTQHKLTLVTTTTTPYVKMEGWDLPMSFGKKPKNTARKEAAAIKSQVAQTRRGEVRARGKPN